MKYIFILAALLMGCAGTPFKWKDARRIEAGMTTAEVKHIVGTPTAVSVNGDTVRYVWVWVNAIGGSQRTLSIDFKDGRAIKAPPIPDEFED